MKKCILFALMVTLSFCQKKMNVYYKCLPFNTKTVIPITEEMLLDMKPNFTKLLKMNSLYSPKIKNNTAKILKEVTSKNEVKLVDYDLRFLIVIDNKQYFINWDKKYLLTNGSFYPISSIELEYLKKELKCKCN